MFKLAAAFQEFLPMNRTSAGNTDRFMLWIDGVGGYWVCLGNEVTLGQPVASAAVDIPILGDLSGRHARIRRDGEGYLIEAIRPVQVDGRPVEGVASLVDGNEIRLGNVVRLIFRRPHALSATARLDFVSRHKTQPTADAILLMADSCVLGPAPHCHVVCRDWPSEVVLYRHNDRLYCRTKEPMEVDGSRRNERSQIKRDSRIVGERFSLSLEAL